MSRDGFKAEARGQHASRMPSTITVDGSWSALFTQAQLSRTHIVCTRSSLLSVLFAPPDRVKNLSHFWVYPLTFGRSYTTCTHELEMGFICVRRRLSAANGSVARAERGT